jgi:2',3'-cyclic-nucleotide 2'-phosphodiesterase (5'-nucleotidase family)
MADSASPVVAAMNAMRYDAAAIGNHEYNFGVPHLDRAVAQAGFPFLSANTFVAGTDRRRFLPWTIVERGGVRVGIVGATTPGVMVWDRDNVRGRLEVRDIVPAVRAAADEVRAAGAEVLVVTVHSGLGGSASYDTASTRLPSENVAARLAREVSGIDLVVVGHSHREIADTTIGGTMLVQAKNWATSVAVAELSLAREDGRWRVARRRGTLVQAAGRAESDAVVRATESAHAATVRYVTSAVGRTAVAWRGDSARVADAPLTDFILEVQRRAAGADLASTAAFSLAARLDTGAVTVAELARLYPYDNTLRAVRITGRQLRDYLEHSARYYRRFPPAAGGGLVDPEVPGYNFDVVAGADYTLDLSRPLGSRVTRLTVRGRPVADGDSFTMALNNYRQTGGGGYAMLQGAPVVYDKQQEIRQLLIDEVRARGTLRPEDYFQRNWRLVPAAAVARAYGEMNPSSAADAAARAARPPPAGAGRSLRIIGTNDFHGALESRADAAGTRRGGAAALATAIARAAAECRPGCETLLLDGGDMFQGTPASNLAYGRPVVAIYNRLGYAAAALGNHEFDWGVDSLRARMRQARYRFLAANVRHDDGRDVEWVPNDTIVRRGPFRIGIVGVATVQTPRTTKASNVAGLRFDAPAPIVDSTARALRARGADVVVVVAHAGAFCDADAATKCGGEIIDFANELTEPVDAIVSGHTHSAVAALVRGTPVVQARSSGRALAIADLVPGRREGRRAELRDVLPDSLAADAGVARIVAQATAAVSRRVSRPVGTVAAPLRREGSQYALGNLIADAQRAAGAADVAVMNNGGIRADLPAGPATYGTLFEVQPFGNVLYRLTVRGGELRAYLERLVGGRNGPRAHVSGVVATYDSTAPAGSRLRSVTLADGRTISDTAAYRVTLTDFLLTGGDGLGLGQSAISTEPLNIVDIDALIAYVGKLGGRVTGPAEPRLRAVGP